MLDWLVNLAEQGVVVFSLALLVLLGVALEGGYLAGRLAKRKGWVAKETTQSSGIIVGGMMTFLAFFLGMSLSIAFAGFQHRQEVVVSEANAIGTAWLLAGTQGEPGGAEVQAILRDYAGVRLSAASATNSAGQLDRIAEKTGTLQREAWNLAARIEREERTRASSLLLQALTKAFNTSTQQRQAYDMRVPVHVGKLLVITATSAMLLIGFQIGMIGSRLWVLSGLLIITVVGAIGLISDLSRPYHGVINVSPNALQWTIDGIQ